jgi:hypothetical protein
MSLMKNMTNKFMGMIVGIILLSVFLPLAIVFILATNTTSWPSGLVTFYQVGLPSLIIIIGVVMLIEGMLAGGSSSGGRSRGRSRIATIPAKLQYVAKWFKCPTFEQ